VGGTDEPVRDVRFDVAGGSLHRVRLERVDQSCSDVASEQMSAPLGSQLLEEPLNLDFGEPQ
jgi:hypothetical protein